MYSLEIQVKWYYYMLIFDDVHSMVGICWRKSVGDSKSCNSKYKKWCLGLWPNDCYILCSLLWSCFLARRVGFIVRLGTSKFVDFVIIGGYFVWKKGIFLDLFECILPYTLNKRHIHNIRCGCLAMNRAYMRNGWLADWFTGWLTDWVII